MKAKVLKYLPLLLLALLISAPVNCFATGTVLTIADCDGKTRLTEELEDGQSVAVMIQLKKSGEEVALLNKENSNSMKSTSNDTHSVTFDSVQSGEWMVCGKDKKKIAFSNISVMKNREQTSSLLGRGGIIGASVASAGAAVVAFSGGGSSGGSASSAGRGSSNGAFEGVSDGTSPGDRGNGTQITANNFNDNDFSFGANAKPVSPFQ